MNLMEDQRTIGTILGRGTLVLVTGQASLMLGGYVVNIWLGRQLGPVEFGRFATMTSLLVFLETAFLLGVPKAVSKHVAETDGGNCTAVRWWAGIQLVGSGLLSAGLFAFSSVLAGLLGDSGLAQYIRIVSWTIPGVAAFQLFTKLLNGIAAFGRQAALVAIFSGLRLALTFALVVLGAGTAGALWALALTASLTSLVAWLLGRVWGGSSLPAWSWPQMAEFAVRFAILTGAVRFLTTADQLFVKALVEEGSQTGYYAAAALFGKAPRFVALALSTAVFPLVARSATVQARGCVVQDVRQVIRTLLILFLPLVAVMAVVGRPLLTMFFGPQYGPAAPVLWILMLGSTLLGLFSILSSVVAASGAVRCAMLAGLIMVLLDSVFCLVLIPRWGIAGAAIAMTGTALIGCWIVLRYVRGRYGSVVVPEVLVKVTLASAVVGAMAWLLRGLPDVWLLLTCMVLGMVYFGLLVILGEVRMTDARILLSLLPVANRSREVVIKEKAR